jgi:hypothetical protein
MLTPSTHRELANAYLLALAGLPFTLRRDAAGRPQAMPLPIQPHAGYPAAAMVRLSR